MQVTDTKPKRPSWGLMSSSSEGVATAIAAWGHFVIMGDTEGSLNRWDTQTGRISTVQTTQVRPCPPRHLWRSHSVCILCLDDQACVLSSK